jgi:L-fuculose-phosphate aldolase
VTIPRPGAATPESDQHRAGVVGSCRILAHHGHDHYCFGHVSVRLAPEPLVLIKAAGVGLGGVEAHHVATVDLEGSNLTPGLALHDETALHLGIYRARPDVGAVVHTHPLSVQAATMLELPEGIYSQDGVPFHRLLSQYDTAELISDTGRGARFAACLGPNRGALLRSHGLVTVGADIVEATALALLLERNMAALLMASSAGTPRPIGDELASLAAGFERSHRSRMEAIWREGLRAAGLVRLAAPGHASEAGRGAGR